MTEKTYYVYLLTSGRNGTLYVGVTNDLVRRVAEHKAKAVRGFTARYGVDRLMWFETHTSIDAAIAREKQIEAWRRRRSPPVPRARPHPPPCGEGSAAMSEATWRS